MRIADHPATAAPWLAESSTYSAPAPLSRDALLTLLEELLAGERAGAKGALLCRDDTMDPVVDAGLRAIGSDEGQFCSMLVRHIESLDSTPGRGVGPFYEKLKAIEGVERRLAFLNRGQRWVVRRLDEVLPAITDLHLRNDLRMMRDVHARNVERCEALIHKLRNRQ